jgi:hypothetical protein
VVGKPLFSKGGFMPLQPCNYYWYLFYPAVFDLDFVVFHQWYHIMWIVLASVTSFPWQILLYLLSKLHAQTK